MKKNTKKAKLFTFLLVTVTALAVSAGGLGLFGAQKSASALSDRFPDWGAGGFVNLAPNGLVESTGSNWRTYAAGGGAVFVAQTGAANTTGGQFVSTPVHAAYGSTLSLKTTGRGFASQPSANLRLDTNLNQTAHRGVTFYLDGYMTAVGAASGLKIDFVAALANSPWTATNHLILDKSGGNDLIKDGEWYRLQLSFKLDYVNKTLYINEGASGSQQIDVSYLDTVPGNSHGTFSFDFFTDTGVTVYYDNFSVCNNEIDPDGSSRDYDDRYHDRDDNRTITTLGSNLIFDSDMAFPNGMPADLTISRWGMSGNTEACAQSDDALTGQYSALTPPLPNGSTPRFSWTFNLDRFKQDTTYISSVYAKKVAGEATDMFSQAIIMISARTSAHTGQSNTWPSRPLSPYIALDDEVWRELGGSWSYSLNTATNVLTVTINGMAYTYNDIVQIDRIEFGLYRTPRDKSVLYDSAVTFEKYDGTVSILDQNDEPVAGATFTGVDYLGKSFAIAGSNLEYDAESGEYMLKGLVGEVLLNITAGGKTYQNVVMRPTTPGWEDVSEVTIYAPYTATVTLEDDDENPISGATVLLKKGGTTIGTLTEAGTTGVYSLADIDVSEGELTVVATKTGWEFETEITMDRENSNVTVIGTRITYAMTVTADPTAGGTVTGANTYNQGASVTLTAVANTGYTFKGWLKGEGTTYVSTDAEYTFTASEAASYTAEFSLNTYTITATAEPSAGGSVTGANTYNHGASVTLAAVANTGYNFVGWKKNGGMEYVSTNAEYSFTATEAASYLADFALNSYTITAVASPEAGGTASSRSVIGGYTYAHGQNVTLTATANTGYKFVGWLKGDGTEYVSTSAEYSFTASENATYTAVFEAVTDTTANPPKDGCGAGVSAALSAVMLAFGALVVLKKKF